MHPMLKPALRRAWRGRNTVQFGVTPAHAVTLGPMDIATGSFLELLDGTRGLPLLREEARALDLSDRHVDILVSRLTEAGLLDDPGAGGAEAEALRRMGRDPGASAPGRRVALRRPSGSGRRAAHTGRTTLDARAGAGCRKGGRDDRGSPFLVRCRQGRCARRRPDGALGRRTRRAPGGFGGRAAGHGGPATGTPVRGRKTSQGGRAGRSAAWEASPHCP